MSVPPGLRPRGGFGFVAAVQEPDQGARALIHRLMTTCLRRPTAVDGAGRGAPDRVRRLRDGRHGDAGGRDLRDALVDETALPPIPCAGVDCWSCPSADQQTLVMCDQRATVDLDRLTEPVGFLTLEEMQRVGEVLWLILDSWRRPDRLSSRSLHRSRGRPSLVCSDWWPPRREPIAGTAGGLVSPSPSEASRLMPQCEGEAGQGPGATRLRRVARSE